MAYFSNFPLIDYDPTGSKNVKTIKDILTRVKVKESVKKDHATFEKYDIKDGESPESIANEVYGDPQLHWVILMFNDIINPFFDWPLSARVFEKYIQSKYTNPEAIHHYEIGQSSGSDTVMIRVSSTTVGASAISNYQYESDVNDKKKKIKLLQPRFLGQFISEFNEQIHPLGITINNYRLFSYTETNAAGRTSL